AEGRVEVCRKLAAGKLTLLEAAAWFRYFDTQAPAECLDAVVYPGGSEGERQCRKVIDFAELAFAQDADRVAERTAALRARLTARLQEYLSRNGIIVLPPIYPG